MNQNLYNELESIKKKHKKSEELLLKTQETIANFPDNRGRIALLLTEYRASLDNTKKGHRYRHQDAKRLTL